MTDSSIPKLSLAEPRGLPFSVGKNPKIRGGFHLPNGAIAFDYTMTNDFSVCPMKFMEAHVNGIGPKQPSIHLIFGAAIHSGLATWYETHDVERAVVDCLADFHPPEEETLKTRDNAEKLIRKYAERYPDEAWEVVDIETPICFEFAEGMYHTVIPDMVVKQFGQYYGVEHKTTTSNNNFYDSFKVNQQIDGQVAGITAKYGQCSGVYINPILLQTGGRNGRPKPYIEFMPRDNAERNAAHLEWWRRDMVQVYRDIKLAMEDNYFRAVRSACRQYSGCEYFRLHKELSDPYIAGEYFKPKVWNPMERTDE